MSGHVAGVSLLDGEDIVHDLRPKWSKWFWSLLIGLFLSLFLVGIVVLVSIWFSRRRHRYIITTERVIYRRGGLAGTSTNEYRIADIRQIQTRRGFSENVLGGGTIVLDTGPGDITLSAVPRHREVVTTIREQQRSLA